MKFKNDTILVITNAAQNQGASFPLSAVTGFDIRSSGALVILDGKDIVRAYAAGQWEVAALTNSQQITDAAQLSDAAKVNGGN